MARVKVFFFFLLLLCFAGLLAQTSTGAFSTPLDRLFDKIEELLTGRITQLVAWTLILVIGFVLWLGGNSVPVRTGIGRILVVIGIIMLAPSIIGFVEDLVSKLSRSF